MGGFPVGMGDWSLVRAVREGGGQMAAHFGAVLPVVALFLFPASLIKVLDTQFHPEDFVGRQGATDLEPISFWTLVLLQLFLNGIPQFLYIFGFAAMEQTVQDVIYGYGQPQSFRTTLKAALTWRKPETEVSRLLKEKLRATFSMVKLLKAFAALAVMYTLLIVVSTSGLNFTPAATAAMGLPPWTAFLFALLVAAVTALVAGYVQLTTLIVFTWAIMPPTSCIG